MALYDEYTDEELNDLLDAHVRHGNELECYLIGQMDFLTGNVIDSEFIKSGECLYRRDTIRNHKMKKRGNWYESPE